MEFIAGLSEWGYVGLFVATFLAGSVVPFSSEVVMSTLLAAGFDLWPCIGVATAGNWLGGMSCYYVGHLGKMEWIEKYLRIRPEKLERTKRFLQGKGALMAFFVFLPVVGDLIIVAFGLMRANVWFVGASMLAGKLFRYYVWAEATLGILNIF